MKKFIAAALCLLVMACNQKSATDTGAVKLATKKDSISYAIGMSTGQNLKKQKIDADPAIVSAAMKAAFTDGKMLFTEEQLNAELLVLQTDMAAKHDADSKNYLAENKKKDGVVTTASGLQYKVITAGTGPKPKQGAHVTMNFTLKMTDGTEINSSAKRGGPFTGQVGGPFIPGWNEALLLMPEGSKWEITLPAELAFGAQGSGPIPANSTLILELEVLKIAP